MPLFKGIANEVDFDVLICKKSEKNRNWQIDEELNFRVKELKGVSLTTKNSLGDYRFIYLKFSIIFYLLFSRPKVLIIGDASFTSYIAAFSCKILGIKYIWWNEILKFTPLSGGVVEKLRRFSIKGAYKHFVSGTYAKEFIKSYGVSDSKIETIPDAVDNEFFLKKADELTPKKEILREKYGVKKDAYVLIYVGQLIERKNISLMIDSFKEAKREDSSLALFLVGSGKLEGMIKERIKKEGLKDIIVQGFVAPEILCEFYALSDANILISKSEPWGMVVNEAQCFGLPSVVNFSVGSAGDLIDEKSGIMLERLDVKSVSLAMRDIKNLKDKNYIVKKVSSWSNEVAIKEALKNILEV